MMDESGATGITLTGNADTSGAEKSNLLLSWERASNVADALKKAAPDLDVHTEARGSNFCEIADNPDCRRVTISINNMVFSNG